MACRGIGSALRPVCCLEGLGSLDGVAWGRGWFLCMVGPAGGMGVAHLSCKAAWT